MKYLLQHIALLLTVLFLFSACIREDFSDDGGGVSEDEQIQVELFTRSYGFNTPVTRVTADEDAVGRTPWVLVFDGSGDDATFVEAAQAYTLTGVDRTFVNLTPQTGACKLLILANPVGDYYLYDGSAYDSVDDFNSKLSGKSLSDVCSTLFTGKLNNPQTEVPFLNESLQMSYVYDATNGITTGTKIENSDKSALGMIRAVAKMVVENTVSNFELNGITFVANVPERGLLHNLDGASWPQDIGLVYCQAGSGNIAAAVDQSTATNPIYLYEQKTTYDTYLIIEGIYNSAANPSYYKMAIVDSDKQLLDVLRNHEYTFTITSVKGPGYDTLGDALVSKPLNIDLDYEITVTDISSYEIVANNDYYLGVSNSIFIAYKTLAAGESAVFDNAFTLVSNCTRLFPNSNNITVKNLWLTPKSVIASPADKQVPVSDNGVPVFINVGIEIPETLKNSSPEFGQASGTAIEYVNIKQGNLEKNVFIKRYDSVPYDGKIFRLFDYWRYLYVLSGLVEDDAQSWIKLAPGEAESDIRNDAHNITVDNNQIYIHVLPNESSEGKTGIIYFTCSGVSESDDYILPKQGSTFRIKVSITQEGNPDLEP